MGISKQQRIGNRSGFTLVEMLVVITIIGILAGLIVAGVLPALTAAKRAQIVLDISELEKALAMYKSTYGAYPPDFSGTPAQNTLRLNQHLSRIFPRRNQITDQPQVAIGRLDPSESLVFWLSGFSKDPTRPLTGQGARIPMTEFDKTRLIDFDNDGFPSYVPQSAPNAPYVYFNAKAQPNANGTLQRFPNGLPKKYVGTNGSPKAYSFPLGGNVMPMLSDRNNEVFVKENSFQIISAGLDEKFGLGVSANGGPMSFPNNGIPYPEVMRDNLTNFSDGTLEDAQEE